MDLKLKIVILFFILLSNTWGQDEDIEVPAPKNAKVVDIDSDEDLEKQMAKYRQDNQEIVKQLESLSPEQREELQTAINSGNILEATNKLKDYGVKLVDPNASQDSSTAPMLALVNTSLQSLRSMSETSLRDLLKERISKTPLASFYEKSPKLQNFLVSSLRHDEALPKFFSIINQRQKLMIYLGVYLFTVIVLWIVKKKSKDIERPFFESMMSFLFKFTFAWTVRLGTFIFLFYKEVTPIGGVIRQTFF